jgi:methylphosphotriester-DNA--protein-cysteine methyltransferase
MVNIKTYGDRVCAQCGGSFTAVKSNQIYCKTECTRRASNDKIIERYHANKSLKIKERRCDSCDSILSKYNDTDTCSPCRQGKRELQRMELIKKLGFEYIDEP